MKQKRDKRFHSNRRKAKKTACTYTCDSADWLRKNLSYAEHRPPTPEERKMLEERAANGDRKAREEIFDRSLWSIFKTAGERAGGNSDVLMENFQEGALGAIQALKNWDPGKGSYLAYADPYIKGAMHRHFHKRKGHRSSKDKKKNFDSGSAGKEGQEAAGKDENIWVSSEPEFTFCDIDECEIGDPGSNPEKEIATARFMLEFIEARDELLECVRLCFSQINDMRLRRFSLAILDHDDFLNCILPRLLGRKVKTSNYAGAYLKPYREFLEEEIGEEARRLSDSEVARKLTNTLGYICKRYLYDNLLKDEKARLLIMQIKELMGR